MKPGTAVLCVATLATTGLLLVACGGGGGRSKPPANRAPVASFTVAPENGMLPLAVTLDANASHDADGSIASFQWDFGDGATATGAIAQHTYLKSARFEVRLSVTDDDGAVGRAIDAVVVMSPVAASSYRIAEIPKLGGPFLQPRAINNKGEVVGYADIDANQVEHAFLFSAGRTRDLGALDGTRSGAWDINDLTQVTGNYVTPVGYESCFLYGSSGMKALGNLGGPYCNASAINSSATVVGQSFSQDNDPLCFIQSGGNMTAMPTLGFPYCDASAVSDEGHVGGVSITPAGELHVYVYRNRTMTDLGGGTPNSNVWVEGINNDDDVIGVWQYDGYAGYTGFLYRAGVMGPLAGGYTEPLDINNAGVVAGDAIFGTEGHAFIWDATNGLQDLNGLIDPGLGLTLEVVQGINDVGQMTGTGQRADGSSFAFILTPVW